MIPVKEGAEFNQLGQSSLAHFQTCWKEIKLQEVNHWQITSAGQMDCQLCQANPPGS